MASLLSMSQKKKSLNHSEKLADLYDKKPFFPAGRQQRRILDVSELRPGEHIAVYRSYYYHHGIYIGNGKVIDFSLEGVKKKSYADFKEGYKVYAVDHDHHSLEENIERAYDALTEEKKSYNLLTNNCEHFATRVATGKQESLQVDRAYVGVGTVLGGLAILGAAAGIGYALSSDKNDEDKNSHYQ